MAPMNIPEVKEAVLGLKHSACVRLVQQRQRRMTVLTRPRFLNSFGKKEENRNV